MSKKRLQRSAGGKTIGTCLLFLLFFSLAVSTRAALSSGAYRTVPGTTVVERGDRVPGGIRTVPFDALLNLEMTTNAPRLKSVIYDAVLEGGAPFQLTILSSSYYKITNDVHRFDGDYLRQLYPSGTQYLFDWQLSPSTNGALLLNGNIGWAGGHLWVVTLSNIVVQPVPWLSLARNGPSRVQISWNTDFADYLLEASPQVPTPQWSTVTNTPVFGNEVSVTVGVTDQNQFYRLRKP
jgi:hypothetical protein